MSRSGAWLKFKSIDRLTAQTQAGAFDLSALLRNRSQELAKQFLSIRFPVRRLISFAHVTNVLLRPTLANNNFYGKQGPKRNYFTVQKNTLPERDTSRLN